MKTLKGWAVILPRVLHYLFVYRLLGIGKCPTMMDCRPACMTFLLSLFRWDKGLRLVDVANCPKEGPAVFAGNHVKRDDPFVAWHAIQVASGERVLTRVMMRDDFFGNLPLLRSRFVDANEAAAMLGALHISRDRVQASQMTRFVRVLRERDSFLIYPSGTRSRTGLFIEYREHFEQPGAVFLFLTLAQRGHPDLRVTAVPLTRTHNPVNGRSVFVFCEPQYLSQDPSRAAQREFDAKLVTGMSKRVEVNVAHVVAGICYLRCLHRVAGPLEFASLCGAVREALDSLDGRDVDPAAKTHIEKEVKDAVRFLAKRGMLRLRRRRIALDEEAILAAPPNDLRYAKQNPVKYLTNQILHLADVTAAIERAALRTQ